MNKILCLIFLVIHFHCLSSNLLKIGIKNDRDEVYDIVNIVYQIERNYPLNVLKVSTNIKDTNNILIYTSPDIMPSDNLFTNKLDITNLKLKKDHFYKIEAILSTKNGYEKSKDYYTFKKIEKINRKVKFDEYGRMYINNELFFPF